MKRLKNEFNSLVNRGVDRHLRLAVTGLSRSGKTAFITAMVNQLLNLHAGVRLPLLSAVREERLLGVKRVPQRDFGIPRFTYDEGLCVQCMHIGSYDTEPGTLRQLDAFAAEQGYCPDFSDTRFHHEIYLGDPRRTAPEKLKTVLRHPIRRMK